MNTKYTGLVDSLVAVIKKEDRMVKAILDERRANAVMQAELVDGIKPKFDIYRATIRDCLESGEGYTTMYILALHGEMDSHPFAEKVATLYHLTEAMAMAMQQWCTGAAATRAAQMATGHVKGWSVIEYALFYPDAT